MISTVMYFSVCVWLKEEEEEETQVLLHSFRQKTHFVFFFWHDHWFEVVGIFSDLILFVCLFDLFGPLLAN